MNTKTRPCRRHRGQHPADDFPLLRDPVAKANGWHTRFWCGDCLLERGHITTKALTDFRAAARRERARLAMEGTPQGRDR